MADSPTLKTEQTKHGLNWIEAAMVTVSTAVGGGLLAMPIVMG